MTDARSRTIETDRLRTHILDVGPEWGTPLVLVHDNVSSAMFFDETLAALPDDVRGVAVDLRGFGASERKPIDATRGVRDFSDDVHALVEAMQLTDGGRRLYLLGWGVGGSVVMQYAMDHPGEVAGLIFESPISPFGFGGSKDEEGTPCWPDWAGSGAGTADPEYVRRLSEEDGSDASPSSPRNVMNAVYWKPPFRVDPGREDRFVHSLLATRVGDDFYPGDMAPSQHWPAVAPGTRGMNNAISGKYLNLGGFANLEPKPDVLWIRGADDRIVADTSVLDVGYLGQIGALPAWPADEHPPQPMIRQLRAVFDAYRAAGGAVREEVFPDTGHSPHIERPDRFNQLLAEAVAGVASSR